MPCLTTEPATATGARWIVPAPCLSATHSSPEEPAWFARLLKRRGLEGAAELRRFLRPEMADLHDPSAMSGMACAVDRILHAVQAREPILIYGDYDVDGTVATVLLKSAIDRITPKGVESLVRYHIPHRIREGYGMQTAVLGEASLAGVRLVISVDTGIRAFAAAREARVLGLDLIVTDHHLPDGAAIPDAYAVVHPNQAGCVYPFKELCGAGVAFKLAEVLLRGAAAVNDAAAVGLRPVNLDVLEGKLLPSYLKLLAIATVADAVPLLGENRSIVALGLRGLRNVRQPGLLALMELCRISNGQDAPGVTAADIAFRIAPRINAAGRMDLASDVVRLLLATEMSEARPLAEKLHRLNDERRATEAGVLTSILEAIALLEAEDEPLLTHGCLVLSGEGWHRGVVGIAASRVVERTGLPALVVAVENEEAHGSGRSIAGFHLLDALTAAHEASGGSLFHRFGGHAHAVGFALPARRLAELRERLRAYAHGKITEAMTSPRLEIDVELPWSAITVESVRRVQSLEPFGQGNPEPVFFSTGVRLCEQPRVLKGEHLKLRLQQGAEARTVTCLCWSRGAAWPQRFEQLGIERGVLVDIAYRLRENRHADFGGPELELCDVRRHAL